MARKGSKPWNKGKTGLPKHSEEHKRKIGEALKGRIHSEETRSRLVWCLRNESMETIRRS